jgi:putative ABC transport system permease protein
MGPPGSAPSSSSSSSDITKTVLNKIKIATGTSGTVIPIHRTNTEFTLGSVPGRASVYGLDPDDITKFLTIGNGTNIVGILDERGMSSDIVNTDNAIVVSNDWDVNQYGGKDEYPQVNVIVKDIDTITDVENAIDTKVNTDKKTPTVRISDASSRLSSISSSLPTMTTFILAIGGISLVVAAVSIFNVMMMSVNERVQEIGILPSLGTERVRCAGCSRTRPLSWVSWAPSSEGPRAWSWASRW